MNRLLREYCSLKFLFRNDDWNHRGLQIHRHRVRRQSRDCYNHRLQFDKNNICIKFCINCNACNELHNDMSMQSTLYLRHHCYNHCCCLHILPLLPMNSKMGVCLVDWHWMWIHHRRTQTISAYQIDHLVVWALFHVQFQSRRHL